MKFTQEELPKRIFFTIVPVDDYIESLFNVFPNGSFKETGIIQIRIDNVMDEPLSILVNDQEWSLTINGLFGVLFPSEIELNMFLDEIFFAMEELHDVPIDLRTTRKEKFVTETERIDKNNGEIDVKKLDDNKTEQEQSN